MDLTEIQRAAAGLSEPDQRKLAAFLTELRLKRDPSLLRELARRLDDKDAASWIPLGDAKQALGDA